MLSQDYVGVTISHGTLLTKDLLSTFSSFLAKHSIGFDALVHEAQTINPESEDAAWVIEDLENALNEIAPEGTTFSAHIGDGSDFGFWSVEE